MPVFRMAPLYLCAPCQYANHADKPNCDTRIMLVNGDHRIGIYANRALECGEEVREFVLEPGMA